MDLEKFSISLTVQNIENSISFYQNLGFTVIDGGHKNNQFKDSTSVKWRILENSSIKIGLFQGMFEQNILTFSPKDIIHIQNILKEKNIKLMKEVKPEDSIKSIIFNDPDGNQIMMDQY